MSNVQRVIQFGRDRYEWHLIGAVRVAGRWMPHEEAISYGRGRGWRSRGYPIGRSAKAAQAGPASTLF